MENFGFDQSCTKEDFKKKIDGTKCKNCLIKRQSLMGLHWEGEQEVIGFNLL